LVPDVVDLGREVGPEGGGGVGDVSREDEWGSRRTGIEVEEKGDHVVVGVLMLDLLFTVGWCQDNL
jgi:hypothetical protein